MAKSTLARRIVNSLRGGRSSESKGGVAAIYNDLSADSYTWITPQMEIRRNSRPCGTRRCANDDHFVIRYHNSTFGMSRQDPIHIGTKWKKVSGSSMEMRKAPGNYLPEQAPIEVRGIATA